jgi:hypothetical protein
LYAPVVNDDAWTSLPVETPVALGGGGFVRRPVVVRHIVGLSGRKSPSGCVQQTSKKYTSPLRKAPLYPANKCCGERMIGNDGHLYESKRNILNICSWRRHHGCQV